MISARALSYALSILWNGKTILNAGNDEHNGLHVHGKRDSGGHSTEFIVFAILIPILVILSGVFAGLTLGYMSLDETQLNVLSISGTP